jgi:hypothetical protein
MLTHKKTGTLGSVPVFTIQRPQKKTVALADLHLWQLRLWHPPAMHLTNGANRQLHHRNWTIFKMLGIKNHKIAASVFILT